jgi:hypothetical protein
MDDYKQLPEWLEAWRAGYAIHQLTEGQKDVVVMSLRRAAALLPCEIAEATICIEANRAATLKTAFHRGHGAEFLLLLAVEYGHVSHADALPIFCRLQNVKRLLFSLVDEARHG